MQKISLILTTYNSKENFLKTYKSIRQQDYPDIEIVVVDGGSTDGTVAEIQKCAGEDAESLKWISERDHGIYDAINKGIRLASGDLVAVFNDTFYTDSALSKLVQAINSNGGYDGAHGDDYQAERRYHTVTDSFRPHIRENVTEAAQRLLRGDYGFMCQYDDTPDFETVWSSVFDLNSLMIYRAEGDPRRERFVTDSRLCNI